MVNEFTKKQKSQDNCLGFFVFTPQGLIIVFFIVIISSGIFLNHEKRLLIHLRE